MAILVSKTYLKMPELRYIIYGVVGEISFQTDDNDIANEYANARLEEASS